MQYGDILGRLSALCERLSGDAKLVFSKLVVSDGVSAESLDAFEARLGFAIQSSLRAVWAESASVDFEWSIKAAGCQVAGMDTRMAPSGQFRLLTPGESESEWSFLNDLGGSAMSGLLPFSKLEGSGELLVVDHQSESGSVELIILNSDLSRVPLSPSLDSWLNDRIGTYFEDTSLQKTGALDPVTQGTLERLAAPEFDWPPPRVGW